jgi:hypothetical protein
MLYLGTRFLNPIFQVLGFKLSTQPQFMCRVGNFISWYKKPKCKTIHRGKTTYIVDTKDISRNKTTHLGIKLPTQVWNFLPGWKINIWGFQSQNFGWVTFQRCRMVKTMPFITKLLPWYWHMPIFLLMSTVYKMIRLNFFIHVRL